MRTSWTWISTPEGSYLHLLTSLPFEVRFYPRTWRPHRPPFSPVYRLRQVHSAKLVAMHTPLDVPPRPPEADGWWVEIPRVWVGIQVADCLPIVVLDRKGRAFGLVHAGWKGIQRGILETLLRHAQDRGILPEDLIAVSGPAIRGCHYPVGPEFEAYFEGALQYRAGQRFLDLFQVVEQTLRTAGLRQILPPPYCTFEHPTWFFSYRRDPSERGRMWMVVRKQTAE